MIANARAPLTSPTACVAVPPPFVAIIDNDALLSETLGMLLRSRGFDTHEIVTAGGHSAVLAQLQFVPIGLAVLDLHLGHNGDGHAIEGIELVHPLRARGWVVLALSDGRHPAHEAAAIAAGAVGTVSKLSSLDIWLHAVQSAATGRQVMTEPARQRWMRRHHRYQSEQRDRDRRFGRLSPRECEVLELLVKGHRAAAIAAIFAVSLTTVRSQIRAILAKLDVSSQLEAVSLAHSADWIESRTAGEYG